jgi:hypothetical protein
MRRVSAWWFLLAGLVAAVPGRAAGQSGGLGVTPLLLAELPGVVTVHNGEAVPALLRVSLQDFEQEPDGANRFLPLGASASSCGARAHLGPVPSVLPAGGSITIKLDVDAGPVCWGAVMVEASMDARPGNRVAVKYFQVPAGATRAGEISGLAAITDGGGRGIRVSVRSRGTAPVRAFGRLEFRDERGQVLASAEITDFGLSPGADRHVVVPVPAGLAGGSYVVLAVLDVGAPDLVAAQAVVAVPERR